MQINKQNDGSKIVFTITDYEIMDPGEEPWAAFWTAIMVIFNAKQNELAHKVIMKCFPGMRKVSSIKPVDKQAIIITLEK